MSFDPEHQGQLDRLEQDLRQAAAITPGLMSQVIAQACTRFAAQPAAARAKVERPIACGAWLDATLALLELALPRWQLQRLVHDDGEWLCSLARKPALPLGLGEVAEATHECLPLAILLALLQARQHVASSAPAGTAVPQIRPATGNAVCCDNFS